MMTTSFSKTPWDQMSDQELEKEYSPSMWSKRLPPETIIEAHVKDVSEKSDAARKEIPNRLDVPYGSGPKMVLDIFGENLPKESPVCIYVHGGYWQLLSKNLSAYVVQPLYKNGNVVVVVAYDLAPEVTVESIVSEVRDAVLWSCKLAQDRGSKGIVLFGHSAGGQLITQVLSPTLSGTNLTKYKDVIKGVIPISGVFDLRPLVRTSVNDPLKLTDSSAWALSPMGKISEMAKNWPNIKVLVVVGDEDSPEFQRQSKEYHEICRKNGMSSEFLLVNSADHFKIVEDLALEQFSLTQKIISFVKDSCLKAE